MASRSQCRNTIKDKNTKLNPKASQNVLADEIALRDEIFELKREILLLKKANERNLIKVRKYEDEAKKKDRQIEELMDPVKNGDVRKLLSTKGAALLLNLKEQNNALIQMVLAKDMQIRKLLSEIKTSKLYTSTKRAESYRTEIDRLRNLLIKSQNMVKESQDMQQRRSARAVGVSIQHTSISSDQSSPRDLEELHFTIQSLETHMKYSNELLAKKNEQIIQLTDQLNSYQCSNCRRDIHPKFFLESSIHLEPGNIQKNSDVSEKDFPATAEHTTSDPTFETRHNAKLVLNTSNAEFHESKPLSASSGHARDSLDCEDPLTTNHILTCKQDTKYTDNDGQESYGGERKLFDSKIHRIRNAKHVNCMNEMKIEPNKHFAPGNSGISSLHRILEKTSASSLTEEESDVDTEEFEMMEKKIENDQTEIESPVKLTPQVNGYSCDSGSGKLPTDDKLCPVQSNTPDSEGGATLVLEEANGEPDLNLKFEETDENLCKASSELENGNGRGENSEGNPCGTPENGCAIDGIDEGNCESVWDTYRYSSDSSFDSQIITGNPMQVEAEINHNGKMEEYTKSDVDDHEHEVIASKNFDERCGDDDDEDDDDVITA